MVDKSRQNLDIISGDFRRDHVLSEKIQRVQNIKINIEERAKISHGWLLKIFNLAAQAILTLQNLELLQCYVQCTRAEYDWEKIDFLLGLDGCVDQQLRAATHRCSPFGTARGHNRPTQILSFYRGKRPTIDAEWSDSAPLQRINDASKVFVSQAN